AAGGVVRRKTLSGSPETVASGGLEPFSIDAVGDKVVWTDKAHDAPGAGKVYFKNGASSPITIADGLDGALDIALDGEVAYVTAIGGDVIRVHLDGSPHEILVSGQGEIWGVAQDATAIYWARGT